MALHLVGQEVGPEGVQLVTAVSRARHPGLVELNES
jgi:hypothetical protein